MWVFDTEDNSQGSVYWINFFDGTRHVPFSDRHRAIEWLLEQEGEFWAVNLEYDLINLFGPLMDKVCVLTYGGFGLLKAHVFQQKIQFRNTLRHWPLSVEEMGVRLGYPKLPFDPTNLQYCQRDCEVTWLFIQEMMRRYRELGVEEIKATLPGTGLKFFTKRYCRTSWLRHPSLEVWDFLSRARYGGRCEVFRTGPVEGPVWEFDINSSYPSVMLSESFPELESVNVSPSKNPSFDREGVACVKVESPDQYLPLLPIHRTEDHKLIFPTGTFWGTWTYPEIRAAIASGYRVLKVGKAIEYRGMSSPFAEYIQFLYNKRRAVKGKDELMSYTLKILMNSLFGKWGEEGEMTVISQGRRYTMGSIPKHSNMVWAAYILAYGRLKLYSYARTLEDRLLYCDTDSLFIQQRVRPFKASSELGALSEKGCYQSAHFRLPKLYRVDEKVTAKGVPLDKRAENPDHLRQAFFEDEVVEFLKPLRFLEARKLKEQANVWVTATKQVQSEYDKRVVLKDGATRPIFVTG